MLTAIRKSWRRAAFVVKGLGALGAYWNRPGLDSYGGSQGELSEPMRQSAYVSRAIKKVAGPIAAVSLQFTEDGRGGKKFYTEEGLSAFWKEPCRGMSYADLVELSVTWLKLKGEFFWLLDDHYVGSLLRNLPFPEVGLSKFPPLVVARPDKMKEVVSEGELTGWEFTDGAGRKHVLIREQVIHCKLPNPYNAFRGLPEYEAARVAAEADYFAGLYGRNLMQNNGDRGPYIIGKDGPPDDGQMKQITEMIREKRELSLRGIFKPVFLGGNIEVQDAKAQAVDAAFVAQRVGTQEEIFLAFGVPPSMAHKMESYSIGSASDWYVLINETCIPTAAKICDCIEVIASLATGKKLSAWSNWAEHPVMMQVRKENVETLVKLSGVGGLGMPVREANEYLGLGLPEYEGWEKVGGIDREQEFFRKVWLQFAMDGTVNDVLANQTDLKNLTRSLNLPVNEEYVDPYLTVLDDSGAPITGKLRRDGDGDIIGADSEPEEDVNAEADAGGAASLPPSAGSAAKMLRQLFEEKARRPSRAFRIRDEKRDPMARRVKGKLNAELFKARSEMLGKINAKAAGGKVGECESGTVTKAAAGDFMFSLDRFTDGVLGVMRKEAARGLQLFGQQVFAEIKRDDPWEVAPAEVVEFFSERENPLKDASKEIWSDIKGHVQEGIDAGDTTEQLAERVRQKFNGMSRERSETIAQTETAIMYGVGRQKAMESAGITHKKWLTSGNENVRHAHRAAHGQVVPIDEPFEVGGEELMHPGDPAGSAGNIINCHCISIAVENPEAG